MPGDAETQDEAVMTAADDRTIRHHP